jgi:hypothetical protein
MVGVSGTSADRPATQGLPALVVPRPGSVASEAGADLRERAVDQLTVRRWVAAPPNEVWRHLLDLSRLVEDDRALDLEDLLGDHTPGTVPGLGARATITRRAGARVERITVRVEQRVEPERVALRVDAGGERWSLTVTLAAMPGDGGCGTDVRLHVDRDPASVHRGPRPIGRGRSHRTAQSLSALLDGLARQLDGAPRQRVAAGR